MSLITIGSPPEIMEVTMRQARLMLFNLGLIENINSLVSAMDEATKIEWEYSQTISRTHPIVLKIKDMLGLSDAEMDNMFIEAKKII